MDCGDGVHTATLPADIVEKHGYHKGMKVMTEVDSKHRQSRHPTALMLRFIAMEDRMASKEELGAAETKVREGEEALARLRSDLTKGTSLDEQQADLRRLEEEQARLIEIRNALFREIAGNDY